MTLTIPAQKIKNIDDFYDLMASSLQLTDFGRNLDALYDVLTDSSVETIVFEGYETFKSSLGKDYTIAYYKDKLSQTTNPYEQEFLEKSIHELEKGRGETLAQRIIGVIEEIDGIEIQFDK